jgi:hypothetical protein
VINQWPAVAEPVFAHDFSVLFERNRAQDHSVPDDISTLSAAAGGPTDGRRGRWYTMGLWRHIPVAYKCARALHSPIDHVALVGEIDDKSLDTHPAVTNERMSVARPPMRKISRNESVLMNRLRCKMKPRPARGRNILESIVGDALTDDTGPY